MSLGPHPHTSPPMLLDDLIQNCQRLSARLPPDGWDDTTPPRRIEREVSGLLSLSHVRGTFAPTRRNTSAWSDPTHGFRVPRRPVSAYASLSPALAGGTMEARMPTCPLFTNDAIDWQTTFPNGQESRSSTSSSLVNHVSGSHDELRIPRRPLTSPPVTTNATDGLLIPRTRPATSGTQTLDVNYRSGACVPSPLRNISTPGDHGEDIELSEIELLPRRILPVSDDVPGARDEPRWKWCGWFWGLFCCTGRRK